MEKKWKRNGKEIEMGTRKFRDRTSGKIMAIHTKNLAR
jgi:hypothetical protein